MNRDEDIFSDACALPRAEREAFLDRACAGDAAQRVRVAELLAGISEGNRLLPTSYVPRGPIAAEEKPSDKIGRYKLLQKIGEGGCGVVWMAEQEEPVRRRVALKVIKLGMDTKEVIARFEAERQALALMDHPNIAKVFDAGATDTGRPYFVMELVRGVPITRYCDEANLSTADRLALFSQVCHAIQHAHEKGIVHRDIKPSNILVAQHDHLAVPKVIDFGIAKATQGRLTDATLFTAFEQFIGTPAYMSPEQAEFSGLEVDTRSDVYSLGVLLYELLTGKPPFDPKSLQQAGIDEIRRIIREVEPPRPSTRSQRRKEAEGTEHESGLPRHLGSYEDISGDLDWIVMHCLEKDRARRYATASDLALDLGRHLRHEPVVARPPSVAYRTGKLLRRHRYGFAAVAVIGLLLSVGTFVSVRQTRRAERAEARAPAPALNPKSIVVLPFENLSADASANEFFVGGMHSDVIASLARIPDLRCVPLTTALTYRDTKKTPREIARELQVAFVLNVSVGRNGQKVSLTAALTKAGTAERVWSKTYEHDLTGIFTLQSALAQAIAAELKAAVSAETRQLLERRPTENSAAYDLFLKAREMTNRSLAGARSPPRPAGGKSFFEVQESLLSSAVMLDPTFAEAWAELSRANSFNYHGVYMATLQDRSAARRASARKAIAEAVKLAPDAAEVRLSHGFYLHYCERDYLRAAAEFEKVVRLQPNSPEPFLALGQLQRNQGKWTDAVASFRRAVALDPASAFAANELGLLLSAGRRREDLPARGFTASSGETKPGGRSVRRSYFATGSTLEMEAYLQEEKNERARNGAILRFAQQHEKFVDALDLTKFPAPALTFTGSWDQPLHIAVLMAGKGKVTEARLLLEHGPANLRARLALDPENPMLLCDLGCIEAVLGHPEEALRAVQQATAITPMAFDHWQGPHVLENLAFVYAWTGDKNRAIEAYALLLQSPCVSPRMGGINVHLMRHALWYSPLRGDPRWDALLADPKNQAPLF